MNNVTWKHTFTLGVLVLAVAVDMSVETGKPNGMYVIGLGCLLHAFCNAVKD